MKTKIINLSDIAGHPNFSLSAKDYFKTYEEVIKIEKKLVNELQELLDAEELDLHKEKIGRDEVLETFTAKFINGVEADIKVCAGDTNCYIDPVLFDKSGNQIGLLDCEGDLLGEYEFHYNGDTYTVSLDLV